ncbi:MAG: amino acid carrier protein [Eubacteriales bacterium]|nr:amino acid carrier protein [Eubacteriales bacterium]
MSIYKAISTLTTWLWSFPVLVFLIGGGLYLTVRNDFVQIKHFKAAMSQVFGNMFKGGNGDKISGWQAVTAALSATLGTGNIVGVGTAIALGGPGAVFWMWVIGFVAMALKYSEATLAVHTRIKDENGRWVGGAGRYLKNLWKPLGITYCISQTYGYLVAGGVHTGSVVTGAESLGIPRLATTIAIVVILALVMFGGLKVLVSITDKLVPIMAFIYIAGGLIVVIMHITSLGPALASIFAGAFTTAAPVGGFAGAVLREVIKNGCARGMYSSDAGNGSSSYIHAQADVDDPVKQGFFGVFEVFFDTIIVCSFTALVILCTGVWKTGDPGSVLAINAFSGTLGKAGNIIASIGLILFAGSTLLAFCNFIGLCVNDMFGSKTLATIAQVIYIVLAFVGGTVGVDKMLMWADFGNALCIICNTGGMCIMAGTISKLTHNYFKYGKSTPAKEVEATTDSPAA